MSASDQRVRYDVDPDRDTPEDILHAGTHLGKWIRILDEYGNEIWFRSVENVVRKKWAVYYDTDHEKDTSHLISRTTVARKIRHRWPDVSLHADAPEVIDA